MRFVLPAVGSVIIALLFVNFYPPLRSPLRFSTIESDWPRVSGPNRLQDLTATPGPMPEITSPPVLAPAVQLQSGVEAEAALEGPVKIEPAAEAAPEVPAKIEPSSEVTPEAPVKGEPAAEAAPEAPLKIEPAAEAAPEVPAKIEPAAEAAPEVPAKIEPAAEAAPEVPVKVEPPARAAKAQAPRMKRTVGSSEQLYRQNQPWSLDTESFIKYLFFGRVN